MGRTGQGPPPKPGLPPGRQFVIQGKFDHAIMPIAEIDEPGEGLTARTTRVDLLALIAATDTNCARSPTRTGDRGAG